MNIETHMGELVSNEASAFREVVRLLRAAPEIEPAESLEKRILATVDAERLRSRRRQMWKWGWAAAAGLAAALTLFDVATRDRASTASADAIQWLADNQTADGTWNPARHGGSESYRPALTALAALALDRADGYADRIDKACRALAARQTEDGTFGGGGRIQLYNQAIATYTLATLCPRYPALRPTVERAVAYIAARQTLQGGWDYAAGSEGNAAITAWQVRALSCAERQGFEAARVPLRKGLRWLRGAVRDDGSIAYHRDSASRSDGLTAFAAFALATAGKDFPGLPELGRRVAESLRGASAPSPVTDCYRDYAKVMAFESTGNKTWADAVRQRLFAQRKAGDRDQWESVGGSLYTAAFTVLAAN